MHKKLLPLMLGLLVFALSSTATALADEKDAPLEPGFSYRGLRATSVLVGLYDGYYGLVDEEGKVLIPADGTSGYIAHCNGYILLHTDEAGYKSKVINPVADTIQLFQQELTWYNGQNGVAVERDGDTASFALTDANGIPLTPFEFTGIFPLNPYWISSDEAFGAQKGQRFGVLDAKGQLVLPFEYRQYNNIDQYIIIQRQTNTGSMGGIIKRNGEIVIPTEYFGLDFSEGFFKVEKVSEADRAFKSALFNESGENVTGFIYDILYPFSEGYSSFMAGEKWGYLDTDLNIAIPAEYDAPAQFENGYARFTIGDAETVIRNPLMDTRNINIYVDDQWIYTEQEPFIENGRVMVPFRKIAEALDYYVQWYPEDKAAVFQNSEKIITLTIGDKWARSNIFDDGIPATVLELDAAPQIRGGRTYVPLRFVAENSGAKVEWDEVNRVVQITTE